VLLEKMVRPERIELPTSWFVAKHSIQLSYGRILVEKCPQIITETESFRPTGLAETRRRKLVDNSLAEFDLRYPVRAKTPAGSAISSASLRRKLSISVKVSGSTQNLPVRAFYLYMLTRL
jgi:hypothetical protein